MRTFFRTLICVASICSFGLPTETTFADSIDVSYTYSGSAGSWDLNFTISNNLASGDIWLFGAKVDQGSIADYPSPFDTFYSTWNNTGFGGSSLIYNNVWNDPAAFSYPPGATSLLPGGSLSGFKVHSTDAAAPTSINWFAFYVNYDSNPAPFSGEQSFYNSDDLRIVGFESIVEGTYISAQVPEPTTLLLASFGAITLMIYRHRRYKVGVSI